MHEWPGVDTTGQIISRTEAEQSWPWLTVRWNTDPPKTGVYFDWQSDGLHLKSAAIDARSSVHVDFLSGAQARRLRAVTGEALTRAIGCQKGLRPAVLDATAGLGSDATVLANVGCSIWAFERQPETAALLADGFRRAAEAASEFIERIKFTFDDSEKYLRQANHGVIYLDPMFPQERKAAPQLAMQMLHRLDHSGDAIEALFSEAMDSNAARVVVKRPLKAPHLAGVKPASEIRAKTVRFDLYPRRKLTESECHAWEA